MTKPAAALAESVNASLPLAEKLFGDMREKTRDEAGASRAPYGAGEQAAGDAVSAVAQSLGLESGADPFGNLYLTLPGAKRDAPRWMVGSHVDSVPRGGNYDGFAGVVAGIVAAAALRRAGIVPPRDV